MLTKKERFTGTVEELDEWLDSLNNKELTGLVFYVTQEEMKNLKEEIAVNGTKGTVSFLHNLHEKEKAPKDMIGKVGMETGE